MNPDAGGEISIAIPVIFTLLLVFLFLFLFTTRNFSLKRTFTPAAILLFTLYTGTVIGLWYCFLAGGSPPAEEFPDHDRSFFQQSSTLDPEPPPAMFSDKIIIHNETYPVSPHLSSHAPEEATPIPDFNYRQDIVPRTIAERLRHFRQIRNVEKQRRNLLEKESKQTNLDLSRRKSIQKEFTFLQMKHDRFLAPLLRNLEVAAKQREIRDAARIKTYDKKLTEYLKQRIETFLAEHNSRSYTPEDHEIVDGFIHEIQNTRIDPNMTIMDRARPVYSGPLLKAALEGRFPRTSELILSLLRKNAGLSIFHIVFYGIPKSYREIFPADFLYLLYDLAGYTVAVFKAAAVLIRSVVPLFHGKLVQKIIFMQRMDLHSVESAFLRDLRRSSKRSDHIFYFLRGHRTMLN